MTVMSYDYHGAWESQTSHLAPLFAIPGDSSPYYNLVSIVRDKQQKKII